MFLWMNTEEMALGELLESLRTVGKSIDEIMQQECSPLGAADITPDLRKQFAFLSGGRGQNGSPIIVFPEFPAFGEILETEFHNVLTYLTSVPSLSATGVGFVLVIDRRQDRWAAVKGTLLRIAGSFPGNLQLVLVLRPTTLLQRTLSDILFKFNKDEFKMKVPVIMLSSVTELHSYIERSQLTQELGGTQEYCHEKWISHRTAIEGFALMVKKTAQSLQVFGMELAETELPGDILATTSLLGIHTSKKDHMKGDMLVALAQGSRLLESINEPVVRDPDHNMTQDELENLATVQRLLSQLDETERAFDQFWARHQTKLTQCLQLRHFEHNYKELMAQLDQVSEKLGTYSEVGISPAHADHIFRDLTNYEGKVCELLDRTAALAQEGDSLIQNSHYAEDSLQSSCSELRALSSELSSTLRAKKDLLLQAMELHHSLERAAKWCDDGIYLLASQPVDRCQSHEGAEAALLELERYLEAAGQNLLTDRATICTQYEAVLNQEFMDQVEKVLQKQTSMQEMFEKRRISLKKLAAKQTRPVQPVAPRPEAIIKSPLNSPAHRAQQEKNLEGDSGNDVSCKKDDGQQQNGGIHSRQASQSEQEENLAVLRRHVMNELLETERAYAEELLCVLQGYAAEMDNPAMAHLMPAALQNKKDVLFGNMLEIYHFHKRTFLGPDVYETGDLPEDDQAQFESEELCSDSVERIVVNPNAAFDKFKDKHISTKGLDFSDRISRSKRVGYESGEYEILGEGSGVKETPQQKYQRLVNEIQELTQEVDAIQATTKDSSAEERLNPVALAQQVGQLKQQLVSAHLDSLLGPQAHINLADPDGALARRLLTQLETVKAGRGGGGGGGATGEGKVAGAKAPDGAVLYELHSRPEQEKFNDAAKMAELEKRLAELEMAVGSGSDKQGPLSAGVQGASLMDTMELLQARVNALDSATLDQVEARLQSVLGKMNEIAKHKTAIEDADTQNKVSQLYDVVQKWDGMATSIPQVVQRLVAVKELHEQAMQFGQLLTHLDTTQQMINNSLKDNGTLLTQVQQTMTENLKAVEENFSSLDDRMKKLSK